MSTVNAIADPFGDFWYSVKIKTMRIAARWKGYRTVLLNVVAAIMPVLEMTEFIDLVPDRYDSLYVVALALLNIGLRSITTTPLGKK